MRHKQKKKKTLPSREIKVEEASKSSVRVEWLKIKEKMWKILVQEAPDGMMFAHTYIRTPPPPPLPAQL